MRKESRQNSLFRFFLGRGLLLQSGVHIESGVGISHKLNDILIPQFPEHLSGHCTIYLVLFAKVRDGDGCKLSEISRDFIESLLVDEDGIVNLILYLDLGP